jgi:dihydrofolate reductase
MIHGAAGRSMGGFVKNRRLTPFSGVQQLKQQPGRGLFVGGTKLALALTELGLIDEYEFIVHPRLAGHGPTLFAGLSKHVDLKLVSRLEFASGAMVLRYVPGRQGSTD